MAQPKYEPVTTGAKVSTWAGTLLLGLQSKSQSLLKESFKRDPKNFGQFKTGGFEVSILSFILDFEVSDQSFEVRHA